MTTSKAGTGAVKSIVHSGQVTPEQIAAWKKEYKEVHELIVVLSENERAYAYIKKPDRNIIARALSLYHRDQVLQSGEFIRDNCWIGGDERTKKDEDISISVALQCNQIVPMLEVESKKL
jgi:hypothetical protein